MKTVKLRELVVYYSTTAIVMLQSSSAKLWDGSFSQLHYLPEERNGEL